MLSNLKQAIEELNIPPYVYHGTFRAYLPSIQKHGLVPDEGFLENAPPGFSIEPNYPDIAWSEDVFGVYVADDPFEAKSFASGSENYEIDEKIREDVIVLKIDTSKLDLGSFDKDPYYEMGGTWAYIGIIPPEAIVDVI